MTSKSANTKEHGESNAPGIINKFKNKKTFIGLGILAVILMTAFYFKGMFVAATVNGQPISRLSVIKRLEKQGGNSVLDAMVTDSLIQNEARKKSIVISEEEVNKEIKAIEASVSQQGITLEQALLQQGMTKESLKDNIKNQKIIEKIITDKIKVTDAEVNKFITETETVIPVGEEVETKKQIMEQLKGQKFQEEAQTWVTALKTSANIQYYVNY